MSVASGQQDGRAGAGGWPATGLVLRACLQEEVAVRQGAPAPLVLPRLLPPPAQPSAPWPEAAVGRMLDEARAQGMLPLLAQALERAQRPAAGTPAGAALAGLAARAGRLAEADLGAGLAQVGCLLQADAALRRAGIPYAAVKGAVIGELAWGGWARRPPAQDIDLLVEAEHLDAALAALSALGFAIVMPLPRRARAFAMRQFGETPLKRGDGLLIDLHWTLGMPYLRATAPTAQLLAGRRELRLGGVARAVMTISAEETLLFLAVHGVKEGWAQWRWVCDIALLLAASEARTLARARRLGAQRACEQQLLQACALVGELTGLAPARAAGAECPPAAALAHACAGRLLRLAPPPPWLRVRSAGCWQDRLGTLSEILRPWPVDWQGLDLPPRWTWLYWLRRPLRVAWKHLARAR